MMASLFKDEARVAWLPDGKRLQMRHGPIEIIVEAEGAPSEIERAYRQAAAAFSGILETLAGELDVLRRPVDAGRNLCEGAVARKMWATAKQVAGREFATPMICVAGAVADYILSNMTQGTDLDRAYVNNGGDIALHLAKDQIFTIGVCEGPGTGAITAKCIVKASDSVRGIATSGWRGRSMSLGIADAVTVLGADAASADCAATLVANAVDVPGHPSIERMPARALSPDSDLGEQYVTTAVPGLSGHEVQTALARGEQAAENVMARAQTKSIYGLLQGQMFSKTALACEAMSGRRNASQHILAGPRAVLAAHTPLLRIT